MELVKNLTEEIIKEHLELQNMQISTLDKAIHIGEMLETEKESRKHGEFTPWLQKELPFSIRTAQKYMSVYAKREQFHALGMNGLNEAYLMISPTKADEQDSHIHKNPVHAPGDNGEMVDVTPTGTEPHSQQSQYKYWDHLGPLTENMEKVYKRLAGLKNSTTPEALGHMIGNIHDMVLLLESWDPKTMEKCPMCITEGVGCVCVNGKIGSYKESEF